MYSTPDDFASDVVFRALDKNGLIKPQLHWNDSGNGIYYTALALCSYRDTYGFDNPILENLFINGVRRCMPTPGLLLRTPDNQFGQEQWDNLLGLAVGCIITENIQFPRQVLWYGIRHAFFFNTDGKLEGKDFLGRFPQVWALMLPAAFPKLKWLFYPFARLVHRLMKMPDKDNNSGINLVYMYNSGMQYLFNKYFVSEFLEKLQKELNKSLSDVFADYFGKAHPLTLLEETNKK